jgi:GTP-binding protein HflX
VVGRVAARVERPSASHYIGSGKVEELKSGLRGRPTATLVLFNHTLSPVQERNLAKDLDRRVVDRTA